LQRIFNATDYFQFKSTKKETGDVLDKLEKYKSSLPYYEYEKEILPDYLKDIDLYKKACEEEIEIYKKISEITKSISNAREYSKIEKIKNLFEKHQLILAFDSTVLTLDFLRHIIEEKKYSFTSHVVTGDNQASKNKVQELFALGSTAKNHLALCSDSMAEGVNLQQASSIIFLDMPSVLRLAEQRIGRLDRMDSPHEKIYAYWPNDSDEFALRTDRKLINISYVAGHLIGSNLDLPEDLLGKHLDEKITAEEMIKEFEDAKGRTDIWDGIYDAFQPVRDLIEGQDPLIPKETYEYFKEVSASVKCKVSIVQGEYNFGFFAIKGTDTYAPRWLFIDFLDQITNELPKICVKLRESLKNVKNEKWDNESRDLMTKYLRALEKNEINLLPNKKKRAFNLLINLLKHYKEKEKQDRKRISLIDQLLESLTPDIITSDQSVDYNEFLEQWLCIIQPMLVKLRQNSRPRNPKDISDLYPIYKKSPLTNQTLEQLLKNIPYMEKMDNRIAACIIGVTEGAGQ